MLHIAFRNLTQMLTLMAQMPENKLRAKVEMVFMELCSRVDHDTDT